MAKARPFLIQVSRAGWRAVASPMDALNLIYDEFLVVVILSSLY